MKGPTQKQKYVLRYIAAHIDEYGWAPTQAEMADAFSCCTNNVRTHLTALGKKGLIIRTKGSNRCINVTQAGRKVLTC